MQGKLYYLTNLESWQQASANFTTSHYIHAEPASAATPGTKILALVEADEGTHNSLAQNPSWQELPHPLSPAPIPQQTADTLAAHGATANTTTFELTELVAKSHPVMRYRPL